MSTSHTPSAQAAAKAVFPVVAAISVIHFLNDTMQVVVPAVLPYVRDSLVLSFTQVGFVLFMLNMTSSVLQPIVGLYSDRRPSPYMLPLGMCLSLLGIIGVALSPSYGWLLLSVILIGLGSACFHPEGSKVVHMAAGKRRGLAQSIYQVGGNTGSSTQSLLTRYVFLPFGQIAALWFALVAGLAIAVSSLLGACAGDVVQSSVAPATPLAADPTSHLALLRVGDAMRTSGDPAGAVGLYRRAHALAPNEVEPLLKLGAALYDLRAFNEAAEAYRKAIAIAPQNADALRGLGNALLSLDQPELALPQFEAALAVDANDPRVHNSLGVVHDMMGNHRMAQKHYRAGLAIAPDNLMLRNNLGLSLALSGDFQEAIDLLRPLAFHPAATPRNRQNLALVYGLSGDLGAAARIARIDLDAKAVESNLAYYGVLRELAERPRTSALGANPVRREVMGLGADTQIQ